jgi:hypothetical protein
MNDIDKSSFEKPEGAVEVPAGVVVECPLVTALRAVQTCATCEHHRGVTPPRFPGRVDLSFAQQHQVACGYPIARRILQLEG